MTAAYTPTMEEIIASSFKDYHVKGFDYLCLQRTPEETVKLYMFEGDVSKAAEIVNPHDHRYDFETTVLAGEMTNFWFEEDDGGTAYNRFEYMTPLNGGGGFTLAGESRLKVIDKQTFRRGEACTMRDVELHTINVRNSQTALLLRQFEDNIPVGQPTMTYTRSQQAPGLSGLYSRFTADEIRDRLVKLKRISGISVVPR